MKETSAPKEPMSVSDRAEDIVVWTTPIRSPWLMAGVGLLMTGIALVLAIWATQEYLAGNPTAGLWTTIASWALLVLPSAVILFIGIVRVRWWLRFKKATGKAPVTKRGFDVYGNKR